MTCRPRGAFGRFKKAISWILIITSLGGFSIPPLQAAPSLAPENSRSVGSITIYPERLPEDLARTVEYEQKTGHRLAIVIEDAHSIPDAQRQIEKLILWLHQHYGVRRVLLEGGRGRLDPEFLKAYPDQAQLKKVLNGFLDRGELSGSVMAAVTGLDSIEYRGIEDESLYEQGIRFYLKAVARTPQIRPVLDQLNNEIESAKKIFYPALLLQVDKTVQEFDRDEASLFELLEALLQIQKPKEGSDLLVLIQAWEKEKDEKFSFDEEIGELAARIQNEIQSGKNPELGHFEKRFNRAMQKLRIQELSPAGFLLAVENLLSEIKEKLGTRYPGSFWAETETLISTTFHPLTEREKIWMNIRHSRLAEELEEYRASVYETLLGKSGPETRAAYEFSVFLRRLQKLSALELSRPEWKLFGEWILKVHQNELPGIPGIAQNPLWKKALRRLAMHQAFYRNAEAREEVMVKEIRKSAKENEPVIVISGGFHRGGLTRRLKDGPISYWVLTPSIQHVPEENVYSQHMRGDVSWKNYLRPENGRIDLYGAFMRAVRDSLLSSDEPKTVTLLKQWRDRIILNLADHDRLHQAYQLTGLLDELADDAPRDFIPAKWKENIHRFAAGLENLDRQGKLSLADVSRLIQSSQIPSIAAGPQLLIRSRRGIPRDIYRYWSNRNHVRSKRPREIKVKRSEVSPTPHGVGREKPFGTGRSEVRAENEPLHNLKPDHIRGNSAGERILKLLAGVEMSAHSHEDIEAAFQLFLKKYFVPGSLQGRFSQIRGPKALGSSRISSTALNLISIHAHQARVTKDRLAWIRFIQDILPVNNAWKEERLPGITYLLGDDDQAVRQTAALAEKIMTSFNPEQIVTVAPYEPAAPSPELLFVLKPQPGFSQETIEEVLSRIAQFGYEIGAVRVIPGSQIAPEFIREHYRSLYAFAYEGTMTAGEVKIFKLIYDVPEFQEIYGARADELPVLTIPRLMTEYGLTSQEIGELFYEFSRKDNGARFFNRRFDGLNALGTSNNISPIKSHPKVGGGKQAFFVPNSFYPLLESMFREPDTFSIAMVLRPSHPDAVKPSKLRGEFLGKAFRVGAKPGSLRADALNGFLALEGETDPVRNVAHLSDSYVTGAKEIAQWFHARVENTWLGNQLTIKGYQPGEIREIVGRLTDSKSAEAIAMSMPGESVEADTLMRYIESKSPPHYRLSKEEYYVNRDWAPPSISLEQFYKMLADHAAGKIGMHQNLFESTRLSVPLRPALQRKNIHEDSAAAINAVQQGEVERWILAGGTGGRAFGYGLPEQYRIRGLYMPIAELAGSERSAIELAVAHARWFGRAHTGNPGAVRVRIFTSELSDAPLREEFIRRRAFGHPDVSFYAGGSIPRIRPLRRDLENESSIPKEDIDEIIRNNGGEGGLFRLADGSVSRKPMGHLVALDAAFLNGTLFDAYQKGTKTIVMTNDTEMGFAMDPELMAYFIRSGKGMMMTLVEKDVNFELDLEEGKGKVTVRGGRVVHTKLPEGYRAEFDGNSIRLWKDENEIILVPEKIKKKIEKGGIRVLLDEKPIVIDGIGIPKDFPQDKVGEFSTNQLFLRVESLFEAYGVKPEDYPSLSHEAKEKLVEAVHEKLKLHWEVKEVPDPQEPDKKKYALQAVRLIGHMSYLLDTEFVVLDRDALETPTGYGGVKEVLDVSKYGPLLVRVMDGKLDLVDSDGAIQENVSVTTSDILNDGQVQEGIERMVAPYRLRSEIRPELSTLAVPELFDSGIRSEVRVQSLQVPANEIIHLVLATSSPRRKTVWREYFEHDPRIRVYTDDDFPEIKSKLTDEIDIAVSYRENAERKARVVREIAARHLKVPFHVFAMDSGLEVKALFGAPGVHTGRYGEVDLSTSHDSLSSSPEVIKIVNKMRDISPDSRSAVSSGAAVLIRPDGKEVSFEANAPGWIAAEPEAISGQEEPLDAIFHHGFTGKRYFQMDRFERFRNPSVEMSLLGQARSTVVPPPPSVDLREFLESLNLSLPRYSVQSFDANGLTRYESDPDYGLYEFRQLIDYGIEGQKDYVKLIRLIKNAAWQKMSEGKRFDQIDWKQAVQAGADEETLGLIKNPTVFEIYQKVITNKKLLALIQESAVPATFFVEGLVLYMNVEDVSGNRVEPFGVFGYVEPGVLELHTFDETVGLVDTRDEVLPILRSLGQAANWRIISKLDVTEEDLRLRTNSSRQALDFMPPIHFQNGISLIPDDLQFSEPIEMGHYPYLIVENKMIIGHALIRFDESNHWGLDAMEFSYRISEERRAEITAQIKASIVETNQDWFSVRLGPELIHERHQNPEEEILEKGAPVFSGQVREAIERRIKILQRQRHWYDRYRTHFLVEAIHDFFGLGSPVESSDEESEKRLRMAKEFYHQLSQNDPLQGEFIRFLSRYQVQLTDRNRNAPLFLASANFLSGRKLQDASTAGALHLYQSPSIHHHPWFGIQDSHSENKPFLLLPHRHRNKVRVLLIGGAEKAGGNKKTELFTQILKQSLPENVSIEMDVTDVSYLSFYYKHDPQTGEFVKKRVFAFDHKGKWTDPETGVHYRKINPDDSRQNITADPSQYDAVEQYDVVINARVAAQYFRDPESVRNMLENSKRHVAPGGILLFDTPDTDRAEIYYRPVEGAPVFAGAMPFRDIASVNSDLKVIDETLGYRSLVVEKAYQAALKHVGHEHKRFLYKRILVNLFSEVNRDPHLLAALFLSGFSRRIIPDNLFPPLVMRRIKDYMFLLGLREINPDRLVNAANETDENKALLYTKKGIIKKIGPLEGELFVPREQLLPDPLQHTQVTIGRVGVNPAIRIATENQSEVYLMVPEKDGKQSRQKPLKSSDENRRKRRSEIRNQDLLKWVSIPAFFLVVLIAEGFFFHHANFNAKLTMAFIFSAVYALLIFGYANKSKNDAGSLLDTGIPLDDEDDHNPGADTGHSLVIQNYYERVLGNGIMEQHIKVNWHQAGKYQNKLEAVMDHVMLFLEILPHQVVRIQIGNFPAYQPGQYEGEVEALHKSLQNFQREHMKTQPAADEYLPVRIVYRSAMLRSEVRSQIPDQDYERSTRDLLELYQGRSIQEQILESGMPFEETPLESIEEIFREIEKLPGIRSFQNKTFFEFGAGDMRIANYAGMLNRGLIRPMRVIGVENNPALATRGSEMLHQAQENGWGQNVEFSGQDAFSQAMDEVWQSADIVFFAYTEPESEPAAIDFRRQWIERLTRRMKPGAQIILMINADQLDLEPQISKVKYPLILNFNGVERYRPRTLPLKQHYFQVYRVPGKARQDSKVVRSEVRNQDVKARLDALAAGRLKAVLMWPNDWPDQKSVRIEALPGADRWKALDSLSRLSAKASLLERTDVNENPWIEIQDEALAVFLYHVPDHEWIPADTEEKPRAEVRQEDGDIRAATNPRKLILSLVEGNNAAARDAAPRIDLARDAIRQFRRTRGNFENYLSSYVSESRQRAFKNLRARVFQSRIQKPHRFTVAFSERIAENAGGKSELFLEGYLQGLKSNARELIWDGDSVPDRVRKALAQFGISIRRVLGLSKPLSPLSNRQKKIPVSWLGNAVPGDFTGNSFLALPVEHLDEIRDADTLKWTGLLTARIQLHLSEVGEEIDSLATAERLKEELLKRLFLEDAQDLIEIFQEGTGYRFGINAVVAEKILEMETLRELQKSA